MNPLVKKLFYVFHRVRGLRGSRYSYLNEDKIIFDCFKGLGISHGQVVDIAAYDGVTQSNTLRLFERGWPGLAVEADTDRFLLLKKNFAGFPDVNLYNGIVTPLNVCQVLDSNAIDKNFAFLNLDIDGYEYYILDSLLKTYRPKLICTEINEKIPPPIRFTVEYSDGYYWREDHFFGQSISKLHELCKNYNYSLVCLHYNNAFLIPKEISPLPSLSPEQAYRDGYSGKPQRLVYFPWNSDVDYLHKIPTEQALTGLRKLFEEYHGQYTMEV